MRVDASPAHLTLRRDGPRAWIMSNANGADMGGIEYQHDADGNHYGAWVYADGVRHDVGEPVAQLAMAARSVADALAKA